jgi:tRNA pseudouridine55 synthase
VHGWLVIDKRVGPGSTRIVGAVKRALREGGYPKAKVGHGGTLDPLASGVLPIALGEATKLSGRMLNADKIYRFTIALGSETDTLDAEGKTVATSEVRPSMSEVEAALASFTGEIEQVPPAYSALKIEGRAAYARARAGEVLEMKPRKVRIHVLEVDPADAGRSGPVDAVTLVANVSKGTYIRSLARDIARAVGAVGHVAMLRRLKAGPFTLDSAISLDKLSDLAKARELEQALLPLTAGLDDIPALPVTPDQARLLRQGRKLAGIAAKPGLHLATDRSVPVALVEAGSEGELRVVRGFNL